MFTLINAIYGGEVTDRQSDKEMFEVYQFDDKEIPLRFGSGLGNSECFSKGYFLLCASKYDFFSIEDLKWLFEDF